MPSSLAMCLLLYPAAISRATSSSRSLNGASCVGGAEYLKTIAGRYAWPATGCVNVAFNSNLVRVAIVVGAAARARGYGVSVSPDYIGMIRRARDYSWTGAPSWCSSCRRVESLCALLPVSGELPCWQKRRSLFQASRLEISGQNDYMVGATIRGDVTNQFVILILSFFSFLEPGLRTGRRQGGKCTEISGLPRTAT